MAEPIAVIGSGFGGLSAAIRLQAAGRRTVLFEAKDKPGGRAYVYEDSGYVFDAGPTVITAPAALDELFEVAGKRRQDYVEFLPVKPFYRLLWDDGTELDYTGGPGFLDEIARLSPEDVAGYGRFVDYTRRVFQKGYVELAAEPFLRFSDMVRVAPSPASPARGSLGLQHSGAFREERTPAPGAELSFALGRGQPIRDQRHLHLDPSPRA